MTNETFSEHLLENCDSASCNTLTYRPFDEHFDGLKPKFKYTRIHGAKRIAEIQICLYYFTHDANHHLKSRRFN